MDISAGMSRKSSLTEDAIFRRFSHFLSFWEGHLVAYIVFLWHYCSDLKKLNSQSIPLIWPFRISFVFEN